MNALVVIQASRNIARIAAGLEVSVIFVQRAGTDTRFLLESGHEVYTFDTSDEREVRGFSSSVLSRRQPAGVVSLSEDGLLAAAWASHALMLAGTPPAVVARLRDKAAMRFWLEDHAPRLNVRFAVPEVSRSDYVRLFKPGRAVVAKPRFGTGSKGVRLVEDKFGAPAEVLSDAYLLEEFIPGAEFSVETFSWSGQHEIIAITEKVVDPATFVEIAHVTPPTNLSAGDIAMVAAATRDLLDVVGLESGPAHTEVKITDRGVVVIESHNRPGGDGIADLVEITTGFDLRSASLRWPLGEHIGWGNARASAAATAFFTAAPGRVASIMKLPPPPSGVRMESGVPHVRVGDVVSSLTSSADRVGHVMVSGRDPVTCLSAVLHMTESPLVMTEEPV